MGTGSIIAATLWDQLGPWLLMAAMLPGLIVISLRMMPSDEWAARVIGDWAGSEGLRVEAINKARWSDRLFGPTTSATYRVRVRDEVGRDRECRAVVGRFMLWRTAPNLWITWIDDA